MTRTSAIAFDSPSVNPAEQLRGDYYQLQPQYADAEHTLEGRAAAGRPDAAMAYCGACWRHTSLRVFMASS